MATLIFVGYAFCYWAEESFSMLTSHTKEKNSDSNEQNQVLQCRNATPHDGYCCTS